MSKRAQVQWEIRYETDEETQEHFKKVKIEHIREADHVYAMKKFDNSMQTRDKSVVRTWAFLLNNDLSELFLSKRAQVRTWALLPKIDLSNLDCQIIGN